MGKIDQIFKEKINLNSSREEKIENAQSSYEASLSLQPKDKDTIRNEKKKKASLIHRHS